LTSTALVVDDSKAIRLALSDILEILGIKTIAEAADGKEAVEQYSKAKTCLVFLDIMMPRYDGFYALKEIRKNDPNANILIITANPSADIFEKAQKLGAIDVISKPFSLEIIKKSIESIPKNQ
jgi:CheY-like chemotaxis protein